jgi:hypothetical protein
MIIKQFRLYPDCHWVYFDVIIHHNRKSLMAATGEEGTVVGLCKGWLTCHVPSGRIKPKIGEIHLFAKLTGISSTSHDNLQSAWSPVCLDPKGSQGYRVMRWTLHKTVGGRYAMLTRKNPSVGFWARWCDSSVSNFHRKRGQEQILKPAYHEAN